MQPGLQSSFQIASNYTHFQSNDSIAYCWKQVETVVWFGSHKQPINIGLPIHEPTDHSPIPQIPRAKPEASAANVKRPVFGAWLAGRDLDRPPTANQYSPGHTLRCSTPAMVGSKRAAVPKNRMRCAAIESSTC